MNNKTNVTYVTYFWDKLNKNFAYICGFDYNFDEDLPKLIERFGLPSRIKVSSYQPDEH